ncbi:MAG: D-alanine--D-alanine ligase A, partial [Candidatus Hydrogenedentes bacterium]|nr:D-alanine--D-alanine ligase A [Candidatus Hydrogenedentota bacterium]
MNLPHVAVIMGGLSSEHEVSLKSGAMVAGSLDRARFRVTPVVITRTGEWKFPGEAVLSMGAGLTRLGEEQVDCVFLALHGPFGEDGRMQGLLDLLDIPYTGSGCAASALAMDKIRSKAVVRDAGLRVAKEAILHRHE